MSERVGKRRKPGPSEGYAAVLSHGLAQGELQFRLFIEGEVVDAQLVSTFDAAQAVGAEQAQRAQRADGLGQKWQVVVSDPQTPDRPMLVFGSQKGGT